MGNTCRRRRHENSLLEIERNTGRGVSSGKKHNMELPCFDLLGFTRGERLRGGHRKREQEKRKEIEKKEKKVFGRLGYAISKGKSLKGSVERPKRRGRRKTEGGKGTGRDQIFSYKGNSGMSKGMTHRNMKGSKEGKGT